MVCADLYGTADARGFLFEDDTPEELKHDPAVRLQPVNPIGEVQPSTNSLSMGFKLIIFVFIVVAFVAFLRMRRPQQSRYAGRHGAYEKSGTLA